jgi:hypothetical protein
LSLSFRFPYQNPANTSYLPHACYLPFPFIDLITRIIFGEGYRSLSSSLCSLLNCPVTSCANKTEYKIWNRYSTEAKSRTW